MTGYALAMGECFGCRRVFAFNPMRVPSIPIDPVTNLPPDQGGDPERAVAQPVCADCVTEANRRRLAAGRPAITVLPGAYDAMSEGEL